MEYRKYVFKGFIFHCYVDGRNPANQLIQLRLVGYPIIYRVFLHPRWCKISLQPRMMVFPSGKLTCPTYGRGKIIFPATLKGDMLVPWRVLIWIYMNPKRNEQKGWDDVDVCFFEKTGSCTTWGCLVYLHVICTKNKPEFKKHPILG